MVDWKKDIKLSDFVARNKGEAQAAAPAATTEPPADKQSIWKRELRLRKPTARSAAGTAETPVAQTPAPAPVDEPEVAEGSPPVTMRSPLRREISFRRRDKSAARQSPRPEPKANDKPAVAKRGRKKTSIVGLKVGASQLAAAHVVTNGQPELVQVARQPLERGVVVGGELRDPEALGAALKTFFADHKLPSRGVRLGVGTNRIGVRHFEISGLQSPEHLENAVRFRAQEVLPIPLEEAVLDYHVVGESSDEQGHLTYQVLLVVAYRDLVERYVQACRLAGLRLVGVDLEAFALLRALSPDRPRDVESDAAVVVVSIGHDRSTFAVSNGLTCEFARVLDWGGGSLDVALARTLDLAPSQAEPIKHALTLNATQERLPGFTQEQAVAAYEAVRRELHTFVRELVSSLHFYQNQQGSLGIGEILLTGGTAHLPGLAAELQRLTGVTVRVGNPLARVEIGKRVDPETQVGSLAVAIGLALEES
ncbi:MAG: type IV pilus assembly protein PilM [Actinomycetota bacterium]|nr:type IV pilus assembly protein PilM [Actinomycetota bacterium]